jgi:hypothetical protein
MAETEIPTNHREFLCKHCKGKIAVPCDLLPTTGPCPYCAGTITSPALEMLTERFLEPHFSPPFEETLPPTPAQEPEEIVNEPIVQIPEPVKPAEPEEPESPPESKAPSGNSSRLMFWMLGLLTLILITVGAGYLIWKNFGQSSAPTAPRFVRNEATIKEAEYLRSGWQKDASQLLGNYLAAKTTAEKLPLILNGNDLKALIGDFYSSSGSNDSDITADAFTVNELTEEDRKRGLFRMVYKQPAPANAKDLPQPPATTPKVHAFFKRTPDGLKLDWEMFAQTKYRTLQSFVEQPKIGKTGVFRVLIMEDAPDPGRAAATQRTYRVTDPANTRDTVRIDVKIQTDAGKTLLLMPPSDSAKNRPITRTATLELRWSGEPKAPVLEISRFICWEFLGLGGQEIPTTTPPK